jgi:MoaA/NifB/PqqE/SkfB family radical SAM enzyme
MPFGAMCRRLYAILSAMLDPAEPQYLVPEWHDMRLTLIMSLFCNIRCNFCFQDSFEKSVCLSDEVLFQKLSSLYPNTSSLLLQGGEVTALSNGLEFVRHLGTTFPDVALRLTTNGITLSDAWLRELIRDEVSLGISLNSSNPEVYQRILARGSAQVVWTKAYDNVFRLVKAKRILGSTSYVEISMVITEETVDDLEDFVRLGCALGVAVRLGYDSRSSAFSPKLERSFKRSLFLQRACAGRSTVGIVNAPPAGRAYAAEFWANKDNQAEYIEYAAAFERSLREYRFPLGYSLDPAGSPDVSSLLLEAGHAVAKRAVERTRSIATGPRFTTIEGRRVCAEPWHSMVFMAQGNVLFCCQTPGYVLGDINGDDTVEEMWRGQKARDFRRRMLQGDYRYCDPNCPTNLGVRTGLVRGSELYQRGEFSQARKIFRDCESLIDGDAGLLYQWAYCEQAAGDVRRSIPLYCRALESGFAEFWVRYHRAQALYAIGSRDEALADIERAHQLDPGNQGCANLLSEWTKLGAQIAT